MKKKINVMSKWKEFNPLSDHSMKDDFREVPSPFNRKITTYLENGELVLASPSIVYDVFSGEKITQTNCILTDGEFSWTNSLEYYVRKYNLQIPKELEDKILNMQNTKNI